jgi:hypothetical protein
MDVEVVSASREAKLWKGQVSVRELLNAIGDEDECAGDLDFDGD